MARPTFGTPSTSTSWGIGMTKAFTVSSGQGLLVIASQTDGGSGLANFTGCTWNGGAMTLIVNTAPQANRRIAAWYLAAPTAGTYNVVTSGSGENGYHVVAIVAVNDPHTTDMIRGYVTASGTGAASVSTDISSAATDAVVDFLFGYSGGTRTAGAGQTGILSDSYSNVEHSMSTENGATTTTMSWTIGSGSMSYVHLVLALKEAAGALVKKVKALLHPDAQSDTGVDGIVFAAPTGSDLTGAKLGEIVDAAFSATLESGAAVLKVNAADCGASGLSVGASPRVYLQNGTDHGVLVTATVIEE